MCNLSKFDEDIIARYIPRKYSVLLFSVGKRLESGIAIFENLLQPRAMPILSGRIEFEETSFGSLRIRRVFFLIKNRPLYYNPKEFKRFLAKAQNIVVPSHKIPEAFEPLKRFIEEFKLPEARVVRVCKSCFQIGRLSLIGSDNYIMTPEGEKFCIRCGIEEFRRELRHRGIELSSDMRRQMESMLIKFRDINRILQIFSPRFNPAKHPELTLFDVIEATQDEEPVPIKNVRIPVEFKKLLISEGIKDLMPVQVKAIKAGLLRGYHLLVVSSTSSGKTLLGELAGIPAVLKGKKMVYLSPLVALTNEKYESFKKRYKKLGLKVAIRVGMSHIDVGDEERIIVDDETKSADIITATYEAFDYLLRAGKKDEIGDVGVIIIDEIQILAEKERGPEIDGLIVRIRKLFPNAQLIGLSATVGHPEQLAKELNMRLVLHTGRPIPLERHLMLVQNEEEKWEIIASLVAGAFKKKSSTGHAGQSIIFTYSRRRAHAIAEWLGQRRLRVAPYHGGLSFTQRKRIEIAFARQKLQAVVTTAALGAGVDFPASQVIFESLAMGANWLTVAEFEQMLGRAGRLGKHDLGKVYLLVEPGRKYNASQDRTEDQIAMDILNGEIEDVSPLAELEQIAEQVLATICATGATKFEELAEVYKNMLSRSFKLSEVVQYLQKRNLVRVRNRQVVPTPLGQAASISYLTPDEAVMVRNKLAKTGALSIAIDLEPFDAVYLSSKLQGEINKAFRTFMPTRFFSDAIYDIMNADSTPGVSQLSSWVYDIFVKWSTDFLNCDHKDAPLCGCGQRNFSKKIISLRINGYNPTGISSYLLRHYSLYAYPGDIFSWLDTLIHNLRAVQRVAEVLNLKKRASAIDQIIKEIEKPKKPDLNPSSEKEKPIQD